MPDIPSAVEVAWLIPLFPLAGATFLLLVGKRAGRAAGPLATLMMVASFVTGVIAFVQVTHRPAGERSFIRPVYDWIVAGNFNVSLDLRIDPLSLVMILVVTGVGALIHLYSVGYMHDDPRYARYFAYLNLFAFSMLVLVLANNFLVLYAGWELVGLCSYLLIGFWFERPTAASAAKKAFITNRVGDLGFAIGIVLIFVTVGSLDYDTVFGQAGSLANGTATAISLLLLAGAAGKSAQIPLHVWLPDAMEGPTPVSALIHAATMVTAGIYMVARSHAIFDASATAGDWVAWIGLATALMAAYIAFVQDDIKRVLAYSTISQLGFMFVGVGVGAYTAGVFHLVTHAFFKALLFLGAGAVMHALAGETDMTKMGGLARKIPWTATVMIAGWLAIIGFPFTSGFFSKDQILEGAYAGGHTVIWVLLLVATAGTGFYMSRLIFLTFFGRSRLESHQHPHESPPVMGFPLGILAALALVGGLFGLSAHGGKIQQFLAPTAEVTAVAQGPEGEHAVEQHLEIEGGVLPTAPAEKEGGLPAPALSAIATGAGLAGVAGAGFMYLGAFDWQRRRERASIFWRAARNRLYVDSLYEFIFTGVGKVVAATLAYVVDAKWIDGAVNNIGRGMALLSGGVRRLQTGFVRTYALGVLAGAVVLVGLLVGRTR
ncbi:MAG TPA: NADH-quinone oxidoreductase subunit L [Actinomycetota bacterium]|nr:NADH-quinone oxidoreductase subunit L [Actinomycetota bacterium]